MSLVICYNRFFVTFNEFRFVKLVRQKIPQYGLSDLFALDSRNDIEIVLQVLKRLANTIKISN